MKELIKAIEAENIDKARLLIEERAEVNEGKSFFLPIRSAIQKGNLEIITLLLDNGLELAF